ncbi:serine/arginine repetitive matrix protein 1-like [Dasypus novemcinctus]|uniref:serine/arginine repetitive matrix protein 1-like n=1 Tax=Dasypus novemcinctus TaxID=9361 RepID=UPI00265FC593|nr:collagen alpha-1(I) chain-like [Dasypus novemcinctus]
MAVVNPAGDVKRMVQTPSAEELRRRRRRRPEDRPCRRKRSLVPAEGPASLSGGAGCPGTGAERAAAGRRRAKQGQDAEVRGRGRQRAVSPGPRRRRRTPPSPEGILLHRVYPEAVGRYLLKASPQKPLRAPHFSQTCTGAGNKKPATIFADRKEAPRSRHLGARPRRPARALRTGATPEPAEPGRFRAADAGPVTAPGGPSSPSEAPAPRKTAAGPRGGGAGGPSSPSEAPAPRKTAAGPRGGGAGGPSSPSEAPAPRKTAAGPRWRRGRPVLPVRGPGAAQDDRGPEVAARAARPPRQRPRRRGARWPRAREVAARAARPPRQRPRRRARRPRARGGGAGGASSPSEAPAPRKTTAGPRWRRGRRVLPVRGPGAAQDDRGPEVAARAARPPRHRPRRRARRPRARGGGAGGASSPSEAPAPRKMAAGPRGGGAGAPSSPSQAPAPRKTAAGPRWRRGRPVLPVTGPGAAQDGRGPEVAARAARPPRHRPRRRARWPRARGGGAGGPSSPSQAPAPRKMAAGPRWRRGRPVLPVRGPGAAKDGRGPEVAARAARPPRHRPRRRARWPRAREVAARAARPPRQRPRRRGARWPRARGGGAGGASSPSEAPAPRKTAAGPRWRRGRRVLPVRGPGAAQDGRGPEVAARAARPPRHRPRRRARWPRARGGGAGGPSSRQRPRRRARRPRAEVAARAGGAGPAAAAPRARPPAAPSEPHTEGLSLCHGPSETHSGCPLPAPARTSGATGLAAS